MIPTLIIGLGGAGSRVVTNVYKKFMESNPAANECDRFICLCFDTDSIDTLDCSMILPEGNVVNIAPNLPLIAVYEHFRNRTAVQSWFDQSILQYIHSTLHEGSGMFRSPLRLAFMDAKENGKLDVIDQSIERLLEHRAGINVSIVTSLVGGTGSGIFLQMAFYVKEVLQRLQTPGPVDGYFILADAFRNCGMQYLERMRANTYASLKELNAFGMNVPNLVVPFEYFEGQKNTIMGYPPYDMCYMMGKSPTNSLGDICERLGNFVIHKLFAPLGVAGYQNQMNNVAQGIMANGDRYSLFGMSKLEYPVDDLFAYFSRQYFVDVLKEWCWFDQEFEELMNQYKRDVRQGKSDKLEPDRGCFFMSQMEMPSSQSEKYKPIFRETQILNDEQERVSSKGREYLRAIEQFVNQTIDDNSSVGGKLIQGLFQKCVSTNDSFLNDNDLENGLDYVCNKERELEDFEKNCRRFVDNVKSVVVKRCSLLDSDEQSDNLVDVGELHPLAFRYFLYEVRWLINEYLVFLADDNKQLEELIVSYKTAFDNLETDYVETPLDNLEQAERKTNIIAKLMGKNYFKEARKEYDIRSRKQAQNIMEHARKELFEKTLRGVLVRVEMLLEQTERFFEVVVPDLLKKIKQECQHLLYLHDRNIDFFVLAKKEIKESLYQNLSTSDVLSSFPKQTSHLLCQTLISQTKALVESDIMRGPIEHRDRDKDREVLSNIIKDSVLLVEEQLKKENPQISKMNVIQALLMEGNNNFGYVVDKVSKIKAYALAENHNPNGGYYPIDSWGINPQCVNGTTLTNAQVFALFGGAHLLASANYSPYEIVMVDTLHFVPIRQFAGGFQAYQNVMNGNHPSGLHLDRNWHTLLPNI